MLLNDHVSISTVEVDDGQQVLRDGPVHVGRVLVAVAVGLGTKADPDVDLVRRGNEVNGPVIDHLFPRRAGYAKSCLTALEVPIA